VGNPSYHTLRDPRRQVYLIVTAQPSSWNLTPVLVTWVQPNFSLCLLFGSSNQSIVFFFHIVPAPISNYQPVNSIFLSYYSSTSQ